MDTSKLFIVVRKLKTSTNENGDIVSDEYSLPEILKSLGDNVIIVKDEVRLDNSTLYLLLTCKNKIIREKKPLSGPLIQTYPVQ